MGFDGFYLSYASVLLPGYPSSLSPSVPRVMKHYSREFLLAYCVTTACWIVEDRCVCHANVSWYPSAYDIVSTL